MRIEIEIPKEFEKHFNHDKFKDSFERIMADIKHALQNGDCLCAGRYEYETIEIVAMCKNYTSDCDEANICPCLMYEEGDAGDDVDSKHKDGEIITD